MSDWNKQIIEEFRANQGRVGGTFQGWSLLLLHHYGARTGIERVSPLAYVPVGDDSYAVIASKGGAPSNPDWYHNLLAKPEVEIEVGAETLQMRARPTDPDERDRIWERLVADRPTFAGYQEKTGRVIPIVVLEPR